MPKEVKKITCYYIIVIVIFSLKFVYYFFLWFICMLMSGSNYNYRKHTYDIDQKYFSLVNAFLFPNIILSSIIMCVGMPPLYHKYKKKVIIINIVLIAIKIPLVILFNIILIKIFNDGIVIALIAIGIEIVYISVVVIFEKIKIKYIK